MSEKKKFTMEYEIKSSPRILYSFLSESNGLSEWFADEVSVRDQVFTFTWSPAMDSVMLNPDIWTICKQNGNIIHDGSLGIPAGVINITPQNIKILPNPSKNYWQIEQLPDNTDIMLTDMSGRVLWQGKSGIGNTVIPGDNLPPGDYLLKVSGSNYSDSIKLVHW